MSDPQFAFLVEDNAFMLTEAEWVYMAAALDNQRDYTLRNLTATVQLVPLRDKRLRIWYHFELALPGGKTAVRMVRPGDLPFFLTA